MTKPDRITEPVYSALSLPELQEADVIMLNGKTPLYLVHSSTQDLVRICSSFGAGGRFEKKPGIAHFTTLSLSEGSKSFRQDEIAESLDFHGAYLENIADKDQALISLYSLNKHLDQILPVYFSLLSEPVFPVKELNTLKTNFERDIEVNKNRVSWVARTRFMSNVLGNNPYGWHPDSMHVQNITSTDLNDFFLKNFADGPEYIIISGKIDDSVIELLEKHAPSNWKNVKAKKSEFKPDFPKTSKLFFEKEGAVQNAIRIGRPLFSKTHEDFAGMLVLSTLLGGYFGSRLMKNIREDKGYTYGIGCRVVSLKETGYFFIATEVGSNVCADALKEIYKEIEKLQTPPDEEELQLVINVLMGDILRSMDGPFALAERYRSLIDYGWGLGDYYKYINAIKNTSPDQISKLAKKYLDMSQVTEIVAGCAC